jgi:hypothetical protein
MMTPAQRKAAQRERQREQGLQQLEAWVHPDVAAAVRRYVAKKNAEALERETHQQLMRLARRGVE